MNAMAPVIVASTMSRRKPNRSSGSRVSNRRIERGINNSMQMKNTLSTVSTSTATRATSGAPSKA